jgi:hypothetical protein
MKFIIKLLTLQFIYLSLALTISCQQIPPQVSQIPVKESVESKTWYCDERLQMNYKLGKVLEIKPHTMKKDNSKIPKLPNDQDRFIIDSIITFKMINIKNDEKISITQDFFNVSVQGVPIYKFEIGKEYLFTTESLRVNPRLKDSKEIFYVNPNKPIRTVIDAKDDIDFLKSIKDLVASDDILGTNEGIHIPVLSNRFSKIIRPIYPKDAEKLIVETTIKVMVLIDEKGKVLIAKAFCTENKILGLASEKAALNSSFSPTIVKRKPVKVKGIITYKFVP